MKKLWKATIAATIPAVLAGAGVSFAGKELYKFAVKRDNSDSLMVKVDQMLKKQKKEDREESDGEKSPETAEAGGTGETSEAVEEKAQKPEENKKPREITQEIYEQISMGGFHWLLDQNPEEIDIQSFDGLKLHAYYLSAGSRKTMLLMHGYRVKEPFDLAHTYKHFYEMGYNLLVPYQRTHGKSEGTAICYGTKERFDVKSWCQYLVGRFGEDITIELCGISMGAATVLMSTGLDLPKQVDKVIADCGFTSPWAEFESCMEGYGVKHNFAFVKAAELWAKSKASFGFHDYSTLDAMKVNTHPVLFIHGTEDTFVPTRFSTENYEACQAPKQIVYIEGAKHATAGMVDPEKYFAAIDAFLAE